MTKKLNARNAWIFPLICWVISIGTALIRLNLGGIVNLILALAELVLLISAIYVGAVVLSNKAGDYTREEKIHAIAGLIFVGLTFLVIVLAIVFG